MAPRIRTIKPDAWQSDQVCAVSRDARLLWVVLITMADDEGRFRWRPQAVLGHGFPDDEDAAGLLEGWLAELVDEGLVMVYEYRRSRFGVHPRFLDHQRIDKAKPSSLPDPDDDESRVRRRVDDASATRRRHDADRSTQEWKGREAREEGATASHQQGAPALSVVRDSSGGASTRSSAPEPSGSDHRVGAHDETTPVVRSGLLSDAARGLPKFQTAPLSAHNTQGGGA